MRPRQPRSRLTLLALVLGLAITQAKSAPAPPQDQSGNPQPPQSQKPLRVQTSLVNVFATVRDNHHALVPNLTQDDFHVFEDGQEQKIAFFGKDTNLPITLGLLIDTSGSETNTLMSEQVAMSRFVHEVLRKKDMSMVMSFDTEVDLLADFTEDTAVLERAVQRARINAPQGTGGIAQGPVPQSHIVGTALYDAIYLACNDKLATEAGRKALVIVTDAEDVGSRLTLRDAIEAAQRADTVIHVILVSDPTATFGVGGGVAKKMAEETGGRVIEVRNEKKLQEAFDQISEELRSQYTLGYYPSNQAHNGAFRKIKVDTTRPGLKVLARRGYYAPKG